MAELTCALGPDTGGTLIADFLDTAEERLDVAVWETGPSFVRPLAGAGRRGVEVRLLLDGHGDLGNQHALSALAEAPGVQCRVLRPLGGSQAHWKLLVAGRDRIGIGTGNLIARDAPIDPERRLPPPPDSAHPGTREWWVFANAVPTLAGHARARVGDAWREAAAPLTIVPPEEAELPPPVGVPPTLVPPLRLEIAPRRLRGTFGGAPIRSLLEELIAGCRRRALVTVPYVHTAAPRVHALLDGLVAWHGRADVRILLGLPPSDADAGRLATLGPPVRVMDPERATTGHAKGMIVDSRVVVMSSNLSEAGLGPNREAAMLLDVPAAADYYAAAFERDWESAADL